MSQHKRDGLPWVGKPRQTIRTDLTARESASDAKRFGAMLVRGVR